MKNTDGQNPFSIDQSTVEYFCSGVSYSSRLTIGQLLELYRETAHSELLTQEAAKRKLLRVVRAAIMEFQDMQLRGPIRKDTLALAAIEKLPAEILTGRLLEHAKIYFDGESAVVGPPGAMGKTLVDHFRGLRGVFTYPFQAQLKDRHGFIVPASLYDLRVHRTYDAYTPPDSDVVRRVHAELRAKWNDKADMADLNLCLMLLLGLWGGLRSAEILHARNELETGGDEPCIIVATTSDHVSKRGKGRYVSIPDWLCELIRLHCRGEYIIQGDDKERLRGVAARVQRLLRQCGITSPQPKHEMRKLHACAEAAKDNDPKKLAERLGHADPRTTWRFYVGHGYIDPTLHQLWDVPFAA